MAAPGGTAGTVTRRIMVSGRVQGVWFRGATAQQARALGISGHARNLDDGTVEVLAAGPVGAVEALVEWLWQGPPLAQVTAVRVQDVEPAAQPRMTGFTTD